MAFQDKVAVVTGGGRGIGRSIALAFAREGAHVIVTARTTSEIDEVASEIRALGRKGVAVPVDLSQREAIQPCVQEVLSHFPTVDILVNNAGVGGGQNPKLIAEYDDDFWGMSVSVNLTAPYLLTKAFLPGMIAQGWGRIINIASSSAKRGTTHRVAYSVTKHGLLGLTKTAALEVATTGVTVNAICPMSWPWQNATILVYGYSSGYPGAFGAQGNQHKEWPLSGSLEEGSSHGTNSMRRLHRSGQSSSSTDTGGTRRAGYQPAVAAPDSPGPDRGWSIPVGASS